MAGASPKLKAVRGSSGRHGGSWRRHARGDRHRATYLAGTGCRSIVLAPSFAAHPALRLRLHPFHRLSVLHRFEDAADLTAWVGFDNYIAAVEAAALVGARSAISRSSARSTSSSARVLGLGLAILLDQKIRAEGVLRPIYLYPMALSFIVTGTAWKWFLDPGIGLEHIDAPLGLGEFLLPLDQGRQMAIYTIVIAAVWQSSGFVMAMFLAGLRGVDNEIIKAAQIDGASNFTIYRRIIIPLMRPVFLSAFVVLAHLAIKSYDLVVALTGGGPGQATGLPATFM